jgi:hypothetical protein
MSLLLLTVLQPGPRERQAAAGAATGATMSCLLSRTCQLQDGEVLLVV